MPLAELDYDYRIHEQPHKGDEKLYVRFYRDILPDEHATQQTGIRKFRDAEFIQIMVPGDKRSVVVREVRESDKLRWPAVYKKFSEGSGEHIEGYPLAQWPLATRAMVEELKYLGFVTVEQVASATDLACSKHPGLRELSRRAQGWLQAQKDAAPIEKLNSELEKRDAEMAALKASLEEQAKLIAELQKKK